MQIQLPLKNKTTRRRVRLVFFWTLAKCDAAPGVPHLPMDLSAITDLPPGKSDVGCFYTSKVPAQLRPGLQMKGVAGFLLLGESKQNR